MALFYHLGLGDNLFFLLIYDDLVLIHITEDPTREHQNPDGSTVIIKKRVLSSEK
jgi:hypothetical protein